MNNNITISVKLHLSNDTTFEGIVSQIQKETNDCLLAVEDGTTLKVYTDSTVYPKGLTFENYKIRNGIVEYYFRDNEDTGNLFAVFGKENAVKFCPSFQDNADIPLEDEEVFTREESENKYQDESSSSSSSSLSSGERKDKSPDSVKIEVISNDGLTDTKFHEIINDENNMFLPRGGDVLKMENASNNELKEVSTIVPTEMKVEDSIIVANESKESLIGNNESKEDTITVANEVKEDSVLSNESKVDSSLVSNESKEDNLEPGNNIIEKMGPDVVIELKEESKENPQEIPNNILNVENNPDENLIVTLLST